MNNFTSFGLENVRLMISLIVIQYVYPGKQKSKYLRAYHNTCGIIVRGVYNDKGELIGSKIFYIMQMEFAGQYVPASTQAKIIPNFMLEFIERLVEKAQKVKI